MVFLKLGHYIFICVYLRVYVPLFFLRLSQWENFKLCQLTYLVLMKIVQDVFEDRVCPSIRVYPLSVCLSVCLPVCLPACLPVCRSVRLPAYIYIYINTSTYIPIHAYAMCVCPRARAYAGAYVGM